MVSATGDTQKYKDGSTTYTLVQPGSTVSLLTGPGAYFGGSTPQFMRIVAYPMGVNAFDEGSDALTGYGCITPAKQIFVVQPLTGDPVNAEKPACSDNSSFKDFTFIARDNSMTAHTFGANGLWSVGDGGTLSYQWMFYDNTTKEFANIADATGPTLTVTKEQVKAWCENNGDNYTNLRLVVTNTNTDPKITGNRYVTETYAPTVYYQDNAVTPKVSITPSGKTTFNLGEQGGTLTGTVSNAGELTNFNYAWGCRVTRAVENDGKVYTAPADTAFYSLSKDDVAGADTNTLKLYAINGGNDYKIGDSWYSMNSGWKCLWDSYKEVTIEYRLAVTENYTPTGGSTTSATGTSNSIFVTIKRPVQVTALSVTQNGTYADPSHCILRDNEPLTFTAPAAARSYNWARSWEATAGSDNYNVMSDQTGPTLVLTKDDYWSSSPYILCVMTDTYTDPNSGKTLELKTVSDRILVHYIGAEAGNPLFTAGSQTVVADPGDTGKTFDGTATSTDLGKITYSWEMVDRVTGETKTLPDTTAVLDLNPYTKAGTKSGAWYFTCTATNTRTDGKSASDSRSYELYIRGVMLTAELTELDAVAGESSEVRLTATAFGLDDGSFAWTKTGSSEWTLKDAAPGTVDGNFADYTAAAVVTPKTGSAATLNTAVLFSCTPAGETTEKKTAISLTANVKAFAVVDNAIELTVGTAVPANTKLAYKGATPDTWTVENDDGLTAAGVTVAANGTLSGTPTVPGPYRLTVQATNGTTTAKGIVTVYVKIPERAELPEDGVLTVNKKVFTVSKDASGSGWNWDTHTGVLTLNNYNSGRLEASGFGTAPLYIRLRGSSTVTAADYSTIIGTYQKGTVLCGSGNLTVNGTGNVVENALDVRGSGKIKLNGTGQNKSAVYGKLTVGENADVEIVGSGTGYIGVDGGVTVNGGKLAITVNGERSRGIRTDYGTITIPAGTATVTVKGSGDCRGISGNSISVTGGKLTVDVEIPGGSDDTYAVYSSAGSIVVKNGGELNIIGKGVVYGIYGCVFDVDGGKLKVDITRTGGERGAIGVYYGSSFACSVKNGGTLNIDVKAVADSDGNSGGAKGLVCKTLEVEEGSTATITAKSGGIANAVELEHITCDGTVNLKAETERGTVSASASNTINVWGKGTLNVNAQGKFAYPFYNVKFNGTDAAKPLTVTTHAKSTVADGVAYLNSGQVTTTGNVNVTMTVESAASDARAYGIQNSMSLNHTAGSITLKAAAGTTLETQLTGSVSYDAAKIAVTGNPKGKDFVTYTAISADTLLISNTSGGAVTLYQNTELSTDELTFTAKGGAAPYTWALTGTLPAGMSLPETTDAQAQITGTPTETGTFPVTLTVTDKNGKKASAAVTITVKAADLVMREDTTTGIFRGSKLYLPLNSDWATNANWKEELPITSISGDVSKLTAEAIGVLKGLADFGNRKITLWRSDDAVAPTVGDKGTITVKLLNAANSEIAVYTYDYEFIRNNPRYLTVGSERFPAMLGDSNGSGIRGTWSWDCAKSTLTLDNYEGTNGNSLVWADRKFSGLTVIYKGNVVADDVRYINHENLPDLTYKPSDDNATLTMKQQSSYYKDYGVGADITFEGGNVTLYPRRRLVDPTKSEKVYVKDVKQFIISDVWLYNDETLGADVVVPQYATDYWLYKAADDRVMSCGSAAPAIERVEIQGADTVSQSGSIALTAQVFPTWLPDAKKYTSANEERGAAFTFAYTWNPAIGASAGTTASASDLFGPTPAVGAEKTVKCTAQLKYGSSSSAAVTSADHTVTVVADGVKVSGQVRSYNPGNSLYVTLYKAGTTDVVNVNHVGSFSGNGQITQPFSFKSVPKGIYDLVVTKEAHLTYTVKNVVVGDTDLDLTKHSNAAISTITLLAGDVNGDGKINSTDTTFIRYPSNFNKSVTSPGVDAIADINGDGKINSTDTTIVRYPENFNKNAGTHCTVQY